MSDDIFILKASLRSPVMTDNPIHIDGLLLAMREDRDGPDSVGTPFDALAKTDGVFHASAGFFVGSGLTPVVETKHVTVKRLKTNGGGDEDWFRNDGRYIPKMSPHRPVITQNPTIEGAVAILWQCRGNADQALKLARRIFCVGGRRNNGYGRVERWDVLPCSASSDKAGWFGQGGEILRNLPRSFITGRHPAGSMPDIGRVEPSYGAAEGRIEIVKPILTAMLGSSMTARSMLAF